MIGSMRSTLATAFVFVAATFSGVAADDISDLARAVAAAGHDVPAPDVLERACDRDALCVARFLRDRIGDGAAIVPADADTDKKSGWTQPPALHLTTFGTDGRLIVVLRRFDARAIADAVLEAQGEGAGISKAVIDLRRMQGDGNLDSMRRSAALFTGMRERALQIRYSTGRVVDWTVPKPSRKLSGFKIEIWTDADIDADAEAFAALVRKHAGARVFGETSRTRGYRVEAVPVTHGWALEVPTGRLSMPEGDLETGVVPDAPVPE